MLRDISSDIEHHAATMDDFRKLPRVTKSFFYQYEAEKVGNRE